MHVLVTGAAVALWVVFAVSTAGKARSATRQRAFAASLRPLGFIPERLLRPTALAVTAAEAATVLGLSLAPFGSDAIATAALVLAAVLLAVLTGGIALALGRGATASCACFGAAERPLSRRHLVRNVALLAIAVCAAALADQLPQSIAELPAAALAGLGGAVVALLLIRLDDIVDLFAPAAAAGASRTARS
jgi:hypothetical protein